MEPSLTKVDVARRQLVTAIRLLFDEGDSVSIFSLAANAWEVIDVLCNKAGVPSFSNHTREHIQDGKDLKYDYINSPYRNFFKHADRDPEAVSPPLKDSDVDSLIFLAVEDYLRLRKKSPVEFQVFQLWFMSIYTDKLSAEALSEMRGAIESAFTNIGSLMRADRLAMGKRVLVNAKVDQELLNDPRTEHVT
jgi:hypothetical protein